MTNRTREEERTIRYLRRYGLTLDEISSFQFMQRREAKSPDSEETPEEEIEQEATYGPGLLHIITKEGKERSCVIHTRHHPSAIIHALLSHQVPFSNLHRRGRKVQEQPKERFCRPSLYLFWYSILFFVSILMEFWVIRIPHLWAATLLGLLFGAMTFYTLFLLLTHFCFLTLTPKGMEVHSFGRCISYPYQRLRKVNFDFARELNSTHVMELLEELSEDEPMPPLRYHLYYIGRVPRKRLGEIAEKLRAQGVDARCSLNEEKRHYHDVLHMNHN